MKFHSANPFYCLSIPSSLHEVGKQLSQVCPDHLFLLIQRFFSGCCRNTVDQPRCFPPFSILNLHPFLSIGCFIPKVSVAGVVTPMHVSKYFERL